MYLFPNKYLICTTVFTAADSFLTGVIKLTGLLKMCAFSVFTVQGFAFLNKADEDVVIFLNCTEMRIHTIDKAKKKL